MWERRVYERLRRACEDFEGVLVRRFTSGVSKVSRDVVRFTSGVSKVSRDVVVYDRTEVSYRNS